MVEYKFETILVDLVGAEKSVAHVQLNRPKQGNAMSPTFFREYGECFDLLAKDASVRCIVISGNGKYFSVGLDLKVTSIVSADGSSSSTDKDSARKAWSIFNDLKGIQSSISGPERCPQPVICCIHSAAVGGPVDLACACDIRFCSADAWFSIKEVDIGLAADIGTLQRIYKIVGNASKVNELCFTARKWVAQEAKDIGFVSEVFSSKEIMLAHAFDMADSIAKKSPIAVMSTKKNLLYSRDNPVDRSLEFMSIWNASMLQTSDIANAAIASISKQEQPPFPKL